MRFTTHILRDVSRSVSKSGEHRGCGVVRVGPEVVLAERAGRSKVRNVKTCGLRHECANCAQHGLAERAVQVEGDVDVWLRSGRSVISATFTVPHGPRDRLAKLARWLEAATEAAIRKGRPARRIKAEYEIVAVDRTNETTRTEAGGWHPHVHLLLYVDGHISDERLAALHADLKGAYLMALSRESALGSRLTAWAAEKVAVDVRRVTSARSAATYLVKSPVEDGDATGQFTALVALHEHRRVCGTRQGCQQCRRLVAVWREYIEHFHQSPRFTAPKNFDRVLRERGLTRREPERPKPKDERDICRVEGKAWDLAVRYEATEALRAASLDGGLQGVRRVVAHLLAADGTSDIDAVVWASMLVRPPRLPQPPRLRSIARPSALARLRLAPRRFA